MPSVPLRDYRRDILNIPRFRLNLLVSKGDRLFLADANDVSRVLVFKVERGLGPGPVCLRMLDEWKLSNSHTNNLALLNATNGRSYLLATGGDPAMENTIHNGSLTVLPLPIPNSGAHRPPTGKVVALPDNKSAWGVHASDEHDLVAVSTNSLRVLVYVLVHDLERDEIVLHPKKTFRSHFCNIPVVCFGPQLGKQSPLFSASIDGSFAMHCAKSGRRLLQLPPTAGAADVATSLRDSMRTWCWSILPVSLSECSPLAVDGADDLYKCIQHDPRKAGWLNEAGFAQLQSARRAQRRSVLKRHRGKQKNQPIFCDLVEDDDSEDDVDACEASRPDSHTAARLAWEAGPTWLDQSAENPSVRLETADCDGDDQFVFLGRQETLHLYHVQRRYGKNTSNADCVATELQQLRPAIPESDSDGGLRIVSIHHLPNCSALLVVQQGGAASVVRLVRNSASQDAGMIRMVVEHRLNIDWRPVVGTCVSQRSLSEKGGNLRYSYEIWIVQAHEESEQATITCFEVGNSWPRSNSTLAI